MRTATARRTRWRTMDAVSLQSLPRDILFQIFINLPVNCLLYLQFFCRAFYDLVRDPDFIRAHAARAPSRLLFQIRNATDSTIDLFALQVRPPTAHRRNFVTHISDFPFSDYDGEKFIVRTSCHGLLLMDDICHWNSNVIVVNPVTKQRCRLPQHYVGSLEQSYFGFAFDASTHHYKVVHLFYDHPASEGGSLYCEVFTLGSNQWRLVAAPEPSGPDSLTDVSFFPVSAGRFVHWVDGYIMSFPKPVFNPSRHGIVSMDVATEQFRRTRCPAEARGTACLLEMRGCLALICCDETKVDFWLLEDYEREVWVRRHSTTNDILVEFLGINNLGWHFHPTASLNDGKVLIFKSRQKLYRYDLELKECVEIRTHHRYLGNPPRSTIFYHPCAHVQNLMSWPSNN